MTMFMRLSLIVLVAGLIGGCASPPQPKNEDVFRRADQATVAARVYIVNPPDQITVLAPGVNELNNQTRTVDTTGQVTFNLIGPVTVAGLSPEQISEELKKATTKYYTNPDIKIVVTANSKFYFVFGWGAVNPGKRAFTGRNFVLSAMAEAGFNEGAWPEKVTLARPGKDAVAVIDFTKMFEQGDLTQNYLIEEGDILRVPETGLTKFNRTMTQVLGPVTGANNTVQAGKAVSGTP
jgi:protein involved in polysaccharide export with SLBB domain